MLKRSGLTGRELAIATVIFYINPPIILLNGWNFNYIIEQKIQTGVDLNLEDCLHGLDKYK